MILGGMMNIEAVSADSQPLWQPDAKRIAASNLEQFRVRAEKLTAQSLADYQALHRWSIEDRAAFWTLIWGFCDVIGERGEAALVDKGHMREAKFFPYAKLNFAENLLRHKGDGEAIIFRGEDKVERRMTWDDLHALVSKLQQFMLAEGVKPGDRIAGSFVYWCCLVFVLAGFRRARRTGSLWPDRTQAVLCLRRLLVQWQTH
jgi:acetoacetyl-CoA synthetase